MREIKIILTYFVVLCFFSIQTALKIVPLSDLSLDYCLVISSSLLFIIGFKQICKCKYITYLILYIIALFISLLFIQKSPFPFLFKWLAPLIVISTLKRTDYKYYKPLFFFFLLFFISNTAMAYYEKFTDTHLFEISANDEILLNMEEYGLRDHLNFRAYALLGHPLTNANIMAFTSFIILFLKDFNHRIKIIIAIIGLGSLFCFNARGSIIVSGALLFMYYYKELKRNRYLYLTIFIIFVVYFVYDNFGLIGGRFISEGISDDSSMARILTYKEFLSIPFEQLLVGGYIPTYGENGFILTIEAYGLILGGVKIICELFLAYKTIDSSKYTVWEKSIVMLALVLIGSTNNNLHFPTVFPFYIFSVTFLLNYQGDNVNLSSILKNENKK